jgi:hypothetical protein
MRRTLFSAIILALYGFLGGCGTDPIGPVGPIDIPFDLMVPFNRPAADYYAMSGVHIQTRPSSIGDSVVYTSIPSFYAQFHAATGGPLPDQVLLNRNPLERHLGGDTLRLATAVSQNVFGDNTWVLEDEADSVAFLAPKIDVVDSLEPFTFKTSFRPDTAVVIQWKRPVFGASGLILRWETKDYIHMVPLADGIGRIEVNAETMNKLRGQGKVTVIRYLTLEKQYKGKKLIITRTAQRSYDVYVN